MRFYRDYTKLPLFQKAQEIAHITNAIVDVIQSSPDTTDTKKQMLGSAITLTSKICAAEGGDLYSLRMESAILIRMAAKELLANASICEIEDFVCIEYLEVLRKEIESFRILYLDWVDSFDESNDINDGWSI